MPKARKNTPAVSPPPAAPSVSSAFTAAEILGLARPCIQELKPYVPGRSIDDVRAQYNPARIVKLGSNENPLGTSPKVVKAVADVLPKVSLYPDGSSRALRGTQRRR